MARALAGLVLAAGSLVWLWRSADPGVVLPLLEGAHPLALTLSLVLLGASLVMKSLRWRSLLPTAHQMSRLEAYSVFHVSILLNGLLPFRLGDSARVLSPPVRRVATAQQALVVIVIERVIDALALVGVAVIAVPLFLREARAPFGFTAPSLPGLDALPGGVGGIVLVATLTLAAGAVLGLAARALVRGGRLRWDPRPRLLALRADIRLLLRFSRRRLAFVGVSTVLAWTGTFLLHYAVLEALHAPETRVEPLLLAIVVTLATNVAMMAPAAPANIGVFHAAAAAPLLAAGIAAEAAVAYAILVHAVNTIPPMLVGAVCLGTSAALGRAPLIRRPRLP